MLTLILVPVLYLVFQKKLQELPETYPILLRLIEPHVESIYHAT
jgi:hypothetical protein